MSNLVGVKGGRTFICSRWQVEMRISKGLKNKLSVVDMDNEQDYSSILICST